MSYNHDWKKDMDALVAVTSAAWFDTGRAPKANHTSGSICLNPRAWEDEVKEEDKPQV